jgi:hypothetical protein
VLDEAFENICLTIVPSGLYCRSRDEILSEASASVTTLLSQSPYAAAVRTATQQQQQQQRSSRWGASPVNANNAANNAFNRSRPSSADSAASGTHAAAAAGNANSILTSASAHRRQQTAEHSSKSVNTKRQAHRRSKTASTSSAAAGTAAVLHKHTTAAVYSDDTNSISPQAAAALTTAVLTTAGTPLLLSVAAAVQIDCAAEHAAEATDYIPHDIVIPKCNISKLEKRFSDNSHTDRQAAIAETEIVAAAAAAVVLSKNNSEEPLYREQHESCCHTCSDSSCSRCSSNSTTSSLSNSISRIQPAVAAAVHGGVDDDISIGNSDVLLQVSGNASAFDVSGSYGFTDSNNSHYNSSSNVIRLDDFTIDETGFVHTANTTTTNTATQRQHSANSAALTHTSACSSTQSNEQQLSDSIISGTEAFALADTTTTTATGDAAACTAMSSGSATVKQQNTYIRQQVLGRGSSGIVYKAFHVPTLTLVAQKVRHHTIIHMYNFIYSQSSTHIVRSVDSFRLPQLLYNSSAKSFCF